MHQLSLQEQKTILDVINRDAELRSKEKERIQTLNGLLVDRAYEVKASEEELKKICNVCGRKFGLVFCRRVQCSFCGSFICKNQVCGFETDNTKIWSCIYCDKKRIYLQLTFQWFYSMVGKKFARPGAEVILKQLHSHKRQKEIQDIAKKNSKPLPHHVPRPEQLYQPPVSDYVLHSQPTQFLFHFN